MSKYTLSSAPYGWALYRDVTMVASWGAKDGEDYVLKQANALVTSVDSLVESVCTAKAFPSELPTPKAPAPKPSIGPKSH